MGEHAAHVLETGVYTSWLLFGGLKTFNFLSFSIFVLGLFWENVFSPKGCQKESQTRKTPKCYELIDFPMMLRISICNFYAKTTPDAFKHVPDLF